MKKITTLLIAIFAVMLLTACQNKWQIDVDLTPDERAKIETEIEETKAIIKEQIKQDGSGNTMAYVVLARSHEKLGDLGKAIQVYKDVLDDGMFSSAVHNNLGRLYEKVGEYDLAVEQYQILIDEFLESRYLYDITWAYIRAKDHKKAEKYFNAWQLESQQTDEYTREELEKLKEAG